MSTPRGLLIPRLPALARGGSIWRLPLNDHAVAELVRLLLLDESSDREVLVADLMAVDPPLTLWAASLASQRSASAGTDFQPSCVMDLARWLADHARDELLWSDTDAAHWQSGPEQRGRWRELAVDAVAVANLAAERIQEDPLAAEAFLWGLLHNAAEWLRSCGPRISLAKRQAGCLPEWLAERLHERSRNPRSEVVRQVVEASRLWRDSGRRRRRVEGVELHDVPVIRRRWQHTGESPVAGKPALVAASVQADRLQQLQRDFLQTLEQEKLASLGELAYGASHEINNPLANISTRAQALMVDERDPERRRMLAIVNSQAFRANEMIADMMLFARPPELVCEPLDVIPLIDTLMHELRLQADLQGTRLFRSGEPGPWIVEADATQLAMAWRAVILNALEALGGEGEVEVQLAAVAPTARDESPWLRVAIRDTGPGISPEIRRHLFDPFFSGREAGRGLGLGLAKFWRVVSLHGGKVDVQSAVGEGTTITTLLPRPSEPEVSEW